jgi:uncharacterized repeat protein (TIGR01451 family)
MEIRRIWRVLSAVFIAMLIAVAMVANGPATARSLASTGSGDDPLEGPCAVSYNGQVGDKIEVSGQPTTGTVVVLDTTTNQYVAVDVVIAGSEVHFYLAGTTTPVDVTFCIKAGDSNTGPIGPSSSGSTAGVLVNSHGIPLAISHVMVYTATTTPHPPDDVALSIDKTADVSHAAPGDVVTYTLTVRNTGPGDAQDVVVTDLLPPGTTFVSASPPCTLAARTVTCDLGTVPGGGSRAITIKVSVDPVTGADTTHGHQLDVTKLESHLSVLAGQTGSATATCPTGYLASDGSVRLDAVDQGSGTFVDAVVLASTSTDDGRGWTGTVRNETTGQLQAKVNVVCVSERTTSGEDHSHPLVVSAPVTTSRVLGPGSYDVDLTCGPDSVAITPGFVFTAGEGVVNTRRTESGWRFRVDVPQSAQVDFGIRCLSTTLGIAQGHTHDLVFTHLSDTVSVPGGQIVERSLTCRDGAKGIVAWADMDPGLVPMGNDPRPVTRVYRFYNPTDGPLSADYGLLCMDVRTFGGPAPGGDITNTAWVATSSDDETTADDSSSATFRVTTTGVLAAPAAQVITTADGTQVKVLVASLRSRSVQVKLIAVASVRGLRAGDVLARESTRLASGRHAVRLGALDKAADLLSQGKVHRAKLVITAADGTRTVRVVRLVS